MITISREELQALLATPGNDHVLLEALPSRYFAGGHLPGARNLPHDEVDRLAAALIPRSDTTVVVYCASSTCKNSHLAAARLAELGYQQVRVYEEGKAGWSGAGLPLER